MSTLNRLQEILNKDQPNKGSVVATRGGQSQTATKKGLKTFGAVYPNDGDTVSIESGQILRTSGSPAVVYYV